MTGPHRIHRRLALGLAFGLCASFLLSCGERTEAVESPPNVLLITIDTLRPDYLGAYGSKRGASPNVDALAGQSVVFERAIAASPRTAPSHATIMTSLWIREHSIGWANGSTQLDGEWTLAEVFADAGYETAAFVGNMQLQSRIGLDAGFDLYDDDLRDAEPNRPEFLERRADKTTRRALAWLARERARPWFLWVHYQDPHGPYTPPAGYDAPRESEREGERSLPVLSQNRGEGGVPAYQALPGLTRPSEYENRYAGEIHFFDHWLGELLAAVDAGVDEDARAIVLFTADHGESMGEEGWWFSHGFRTTPDQVHVPFLLRAPGLSPARRSALVHHVDVAPTLLELAGLTPPSPASGAALVSASGSDSALAERIVYADVGFEASAYQGAGFTRTDLEKLPLEPSSHRWSSTSVWVPERTRREVLDGFEQYLAIRPELVPAQPLDPRAQQERLRQLRALGYVEAGEEEEPLPPPSR